MRVSERMLFTTRFRLCSASYAPTSRSRRREKICFLFCWEDRKGKIYSVIAFRIIAVQIRTHFWTKAMYCRKACCYLFSFLSKENKSKNKLCVLRGSAVRIVLSKTLSGSPFKPPFLVVVVDYLRATRVLKSNGCCFRIARHYLALKLNFWPPMVASYIKPPLACTNTAIPF